MFAGSSLPSLAAAAAALRSPTVAVRLLSDATEVIATTVRSYRCGGDIEDASDGDGSECQRDPTDPAASPMPGGLLARDVSFDFHVELLMLATRFIEP